MKVKRSTLRLGNWTIQFWGDPRKRFAPILARRHMSLKLLQAFRGGVIVGEKRKSPDVVGPARGLFQAKFEKGKTVGYVTVFFFSTIPGRLL